jgi:signal transduction histidine kinase
MLHTGWLLATLAGFTLAALPLVSNVAGVPPMMTIGAVLTAAAFALLIHLLMRAATVRAITLQLAEAETARTLANKLAETEALQAQLLHAQRMEAVGTLAAGLAHDMNNVLGAVSNLGELLLQSARSDQRGDLGQIIAHAARGAELTRGLLAFSRRGQYRTRTIELERMLRDLLPLLRRMLPKSIVIREQLALRGACIDADPVQLAQVITNLALNAADAMNGTGMIELTATIVDEGPPSRVRLVIRDNGPGMDAETRLRAFEPFFTTKPLGKGTGLGLAVAWGIVQAHAGTIAIESELGQGAAFTIELPTTIARVAPEPVRPSSAHPVVRSMVLVVDDDRAVRETTSRLLTRLGLEVVVAENGEEALRVFRAHPDQIRLVVLDMGMPVMGGAECFLRLRTQSDVPVLIATGYADDEQVRDAVSAGAQIIEKPFSAAQLREQVTRLIDVIPIAAAS